MRNKVFGKQLSRNRKSREALFNGLVKAVIEHGSVKTTLAKAQAIQPDLDKLMKFVKDPTLAAKRNAAAALRNDRTAVAKLFTYESLAKSRNGGYTSITKLPPRRGDNAALATISFMVVEGQPEAKAKKAEKGDKSQVTTEK
mgnify:CR=1 FL=1